MSGTIFFGQIVYCDSFDELNLIPNGYIAIDKSGKICGIGVTSKFNEWIHPGKESFTKRRLRKSQFLFPGFIDCHIHAPQMPNIGLGLDKPLLDWLNAYTFPLEAEYKNAEFAEKVYKQVVRHCLNVGTTTACYFGTIHKRSNKILADEAIRQGQRAFVGKVSMDRLSPDYYVESLEDSLKDNEDFIEYVLSKKSSLVQPVITPRFAITCSEALMKGLSDLAKRYNLLIQSHMSENLGEVEYVKNVFPDSINYAEVYKKYGLLTKKTIMAHCVHIENEELQIFNECGAAAIHCPHSNTNLSSGLCDIKRIRDAGVKFGLGSDISGGNRVGMIDVLRHGLQVSQVINFMKTQEIKGTGRIQSASRENYAPLNYKNALYMATLAGAKALCIDDKVGSFKLGMEFDALLIDTSIEPIIDYDLSGTKVAKIDPVNILEGHIQKFVYVGDDRNIAEVYVQGRKVK